MKLAEIQAGKNYLVYSREDWLRAAWAESYPKVAEQLKRNRWTPVTDENGNVRRDYKGRVVMTDGRGNTDYVMLKQIRAEWREGVALITNTNRAKRNRYNDAGIRYAEHLKRKAQREREQIEKPIKDEFWQAMKELNPNVWSETKLGNLPIEVMQAIATALKNK
jgi:hypothetical protein